MMNTASSSGLKKVALLVLQLVSFLLLLPLLVGYWVGCFGFETISKGLSLIPGKFGISLRRMWYWTTLDRCGANFTVDFIAAIRTPKTRVGDNVYIGHGCWIGWAEIGSDVMLGGQIVVLSGNAHHSFERTDVPIRLQQGNPRRVIIGDDVWVGAGAIIMADVSKGCVVGAGSVVTKTFPEYSIVSGVPAHVIKSRLHQSVETSEEAL